MAETSRGPEPGERAFWPWLGFWVQLIVLGLFVVIGAFCASESREPGDYASGMLLIVGALALAFLRLKRRFDGGGPGWRDFLFVDDMISLAIAIPLFTVIGLAGLFIASAWPDGSLHDAGLGLFVVSGVIIFLDIKTVYDRINSTTR
jgi:uncharacterized membrane protein